MNIAGNRISLCKLLWSTRTPSAPPIKTTSLSTLFLFAPNMHHCDHFSVRDSFTLYWRPIAHTSRPQIGTHKIFWSQDNFCAYFLAYMLSCRSWRWCRKLLATSHGHWTASRELPPSLTTSLHTFKVLVPLLSDELRRSTRRWLRSIGRTSVATLFASLMLFLYVARALISSTWPTQWWQKVKPSKCQLSGKLYGTYFIRFRFLSSMRAPLKIAHAHTSPWYRSNVKNHRNVIWSVLGLK